MYSKHIYVVFITLLILNGEVKGKKQKKNKYPPIKDDETSPQPNVVAYSTFGFNDVGSYDGFVPSSPDYTSFLSGVNQESTTRLYGPAFPTASDVTGLGTSYGSQPFQGQTFGSNEDGEQSSIVQYPQDTVNFFSTANLDNDDYTKIKGSDESYRPSDGDSNAPVYGTKLSLKNKNKSVNHNSELNAYPSGYSSLKDDHYHIFANTPTTHENKHTHNEPNHKDSLTSFPTSSFENYVKSQRNNVQNQLKFPTVVDFTNMKTVYPTALDNIATTTPKPLNSFTFSNLQTESFYTKPFINNFNKFIKETSAFEDTFDIKANEDFTTEKNILKPNSFHDQSSTFNFSTSHTKNTVPYIKPNLEYKKKSKNKPWTLNKNSTNDFKNWNDVSALKGYEYNTNNSNMSFKYEFDDKKRPFMSNVEEILPASSNLANYHFTESDFSNFKKMPKVTDDVDDFSSFGYTKDFKPKGKDYSDLYKDLLSTVPTTTSYWGNVFKSNDYSFSNHYPKKSPYVDDINEDVVTIPKRPHKFSLGKNVENKPSEWSFGSQRPYKSNKPQKDWIKETTRFKSEEDLLGLRNHDTSHPSYLPTYKPTYENSVPDDNFNEYRNLIEKWRQSYLKSKLKDSLRDYDAFATENKPQHVPVPKPYPIEVPHPVIVPVPEPYPVRVPISKPVAVPVFKELIVPIEKPVPYPVFKNVPYPVEKPVPVRVEKEVAVPVIKPYPVPIPYVRPVFHHTRHPHDDPDTDQRNQFDDNDYMPRQEGSNKKQQYKRRPYSSRNRSRRPSRNTYQERSRRRWPDHRRPTASDHRYKYPHTEDFYQSHYRHHKEVPEDDRSDRFSYCKRTGHC